MIDIVNKYAKADQPAPAFHLGYAVDFGGKRAAGRALAHVIEEGEIGALQLIEVFLHIAATAGQWRTPIHFAYHLRIGVDQAHRIFGAGPQIELAIA